MKTFFILISIFGSVSALANAPARYSCTPTKNSDGDPITTETDGQKMVLTGQSIRGEAKGTLNKNYISRYKDGALEFTGFPGFTAEENEITYTCVRQD